MNKTSTISPPLILSLSLTVIGCATQPDVENEVSFLQVGDPHSVMKCTKDYAGGRSCTKDGVPVSLSALSYDAVKLQPSLSEMIADSDVTTDAACIRQHCHLYVCALFVSEFGWFTIECDVNPRGNDECNIACDGIRGSCPNFFSPPIDNALESCHQRFPNDDIQAAECATQLLNGIQPSCQSSGSDN